MGIQIRKTLRRWQATYVWAVLLLTLAGTGARAQQTLYDDQLASGWGNYSWAANDPNNASPIHGGAHSIKVTAAAGSYGALELRSATPLDGAKYGALTFWINGGTTGGQRHLLVKASVGGKQQKSVALPPLVADQWTQVTVPLADLGVATETNLTGFLIQNGSAEGTPTFYVDDVALTAGAKTAPFVPAPRPHVAHPLAFTGVNLSGGEFGNPKPGVLQAYGTDFVYPSPGEFDYFARKGVNVVRLGFRWETLQPVPGEPLLPAEADRLQAVVDGATRKGMTVLLDPHNYARYYGKVVGGPDVSDAAFADFWGRLAARYKGSPRVWFGLMNEPYNMPTDQWLGAANAAIAAIRKAGAKNLILVPGNGYTSAPLWTRVGNDVAMLKIKDPANRCVFELHCYFDSDCSGTHTDVVSPAVGKDRVRDFVLWCRKNHQRGFLGEFGASGSPEADAAVTDLLSSMEQDRDVWVGFTWWSAGPWWGEYPFTVEPRGGQDRPQMAYLEPHLQRMPNPKTPLRRQ